MEIARSWTLFETSGRLFIFFELNGDAIKGD
jgi:hypothetical protein